MSGLSSFVRLCRQAQHLGDIAYNHLAENARVQAVQGDDKLRLRWRFPLGAGQIGAAQCHLIRIRTRTNIERRRTAARIVDGGGGLTRDHRRVEHGNVVLCPTLTVYCRTARCLIQPHILHPHRQRRRTGAAVLTRRGNRERAVPWRRRRSLFLTIDGQGGIGVRSAIAIHPARLHWHRCKSPTRHTRPAAARGTMVQARPDDKGRLQPQAGNPCRIGSAALENQWFGVKIAFGAITHLVADGLSISFQKRAGFAVGGTMLPGARRNRVAELAQRSRRSLTVTQRRLGGSGQRQQEHEREEEHNGRSPCSAFAPGVRCTHR